MLIGLGGWANSPEINRLGASIRDTRVSIKSLHLYAGYLILRSHGSSSLFDTSFCVCMVDVLDIPHY